jgi:hypothetical protein
MDGGAEMVGRQVFWLQLGLQHLRGKFSYTSVSI